MFWNYKEVIDALSDFKVEVGDGPGGDWDLVPLYVQHLEKCSDEDDSIHITPFIDPNNRAGVSDPTEDQEVYAVEVRNQFGDSHGGCETDDADIEHMYAEIKNILKKMGHRVIGHYHQIF